MRIPFDLAELAKTQSISLQLSKQAAQYLEMNELLGFSGAVAEARKIEIEHTSASRLLGYNVQNGLRELVRMQESMASAFSRAETGWAKVASDFAKVATQTLAGPLASYSPGITAADRLSAMGDLQQAIAQRVASVETNTWMLSAYERTVADLQDKLHSMLDVASIVKPASLGFEVSNSARFVDTFRDLIAGVDLDELQSLASTTGKLLADHFEALEDDEIPPTSEDLHEAVKQAKLPAVRKKVEAQVTAALSESLAPGSLSASPVPSSFRQLAVLSILMPVFIAIVAAIFQVEYERWRNRTGLEDAGHGESPKSNHSVILSDAVFVDADGLNLRAGPSTTQRVVATAQRGHLLVIIKYKGPWARVRYVDPDSEGAEHTGWVKRRHTKAISEETMRMIWCNLMAPSEWSREYCE